MNNNSNISEEPKAPNSQLPDDLKAALSFLQKRGLNIGDNIQPELEEEDEPDENDEIESLDAMDTFNYTDMDDIKETNEEVNDLDDIF